MLLPGHFFFGYCGVEYKFLGFSSWKKFLYKPLSNCGPLSVTIDFGILNRQTIFFHTNRMTSLSLMEAKASASINLLK